MKIEAGSNKVYFLIERSIYFFYYFIRLDKINNWGLGNVTNFYPSLISITGTSRRLE